MYFSNLCRCCYQRSKSYANTALQNMIKVGGSVEATASPWNMRSRVQGDPREVDRAEGCRSPLPGETKWSNGDSPAEGMRRGQGKGRRRDSPEVRSQTAEREPAYCLRSRLEGQTPHTQSRGGRTAFTSKTPPRAVYKKHEDRPRVCRRQGVRHTVPPTRSWKGCVNMRADSGTRRIHEDKEGQSTTKPRSVPQEDITVLKST